METTMEIYGYYYKNLQKYDAIRSIASDYRYGYLENTRDIFTDYHDMVWEDKYGNNRQHGISMTFWTRKLSLDIIILDPMMTTARKWEEGARHPILTHCEVYELE